MITILTGNNSYEIKSTVRQLTAKFEGSVERVDGTEIDLNRLADLLAGGGLFAERKLVIIDGLSGNKTIWPVLGDWLSRVNDDTELVLIEEPSLDKRTSAYKALKKVAEIKEFTNWSDREQPKAIGWVIEQANERGLKLDRATAAELVRHCMVATGRPGRMDIDQWRLHHGIEKLRALDNPTPDDVKNLIEAEPQENSFEILQLALSGNSDTLQERLAVLRQTEEPHRLFGLLANQTYQLALLVNTDKPAAAVAADLGVHEYPVKRLQPLAQKLGKGGVKQLVDTMSEVDMKIKSSGHDTWQLVENLLLGLSSKSR